MGLLGNGWDDPQSSAIMALAGGMLKGDLGGGLLGANSAYSQSKQDAAKQQFMQMQMQNYQSEIDARKAALAKQQALQAATQQFFGGSNGAQPAQSGQLGSGTFGVLPPPAGQSDMPAQRPSGIGGKTLDEVLAYHALGGPDMLPAYKFAKEGIERHPGSFYEDLQGRRQYVGDPTKGINYDGTTVSLMPGFQNATAGITLATEAPKALLNAAGKINLRPNADGTQSPVSELSENPTLQNMLGNLFPGQGGSTMPTRPMPTQPTQRQMGSAPTIAPQQASVPAQPSTGSFVGNPEQVSASIDMIADPQQRANARAAFESQMEATGGRLGPYGKTTQQETQAAADKEQLVQQAKDVADQRKSIMNAGFVAPANISKYQQIGKLLQDVDGGTLTPTGTHLASLANSVGIKIDKSLPNKEAAAALANEAALQLRSPAGGAGMPGAMSDQDRSFLASMTPSMTQSAQGRKQVIDSYIAVQTRNQQVATFARNYEKKHGKLDNGFFDQLQAWSSVNPVFKGQ